MKWDSSKTYSQSDMLKMQQDATRRVREMQARAERTLQNANTEHGSQPITYNAPPPIPSTIHANAMPDTPHVINNQRVGGGGSAATGGIDSLLSSGSNLITNVLSYFTGSKTEEGELSPIAAIFDVLHLDKERLIVLGLLVVLMNEKADKTMLLALFYLLF